MFISQTPAHRTQESWWGCCTRQDYAVGLVTSQMARVYERGILAQFYLLNAFMTLLIVYTWLYVCVRRCVLRAVCSSHLVSLCTWEMCFLLPWTTCAVLRAL